MDKQHKSPSPAMLEHDAALLPSEAARLTARVLEECFLGAEDFGTFGTFIDAGFMELLASLSAQEASTPVAGASIATHIRHTSFALDVYAKGILGNQPGSFAIDWAKDWETNTMSDKQWQSLQAHLAEQLETLIATICGHAANNSYSFRTSLAALAHTAFHLGAIQVKFDELKS